MLIGILSRFSWFDFNFRLLIWHKMRFQNPFVLVLHTKQIMHLTLCRTQNVNEFSLVLSNIAKHVIHHPINEQLSAVVRFVHSKYIQLLNFSISLLSSDFRSHNFLFPFRFSMFFLFNHCRIFGLVFFLFICSKK